MPKISFEIPHVFEIRFPTASMPTPNLGQLNFSHDDQGYSFLMPREDFERLARKMTELLSAKA
jgi:hypothetical protein